MRSKILELLHKQGKNCISGEEIARQLGVTRSAVWKHITELREAGYNIISQPKSGYSLVETPDKLLAAEIARNLATKVIGNNIIALDEVDSTNNEAKRLAAKGAPEGTIVVAERQTGGKGRLERHFFSPAGKGIWFSVILRPKFLPQEAPKCTLMAAVAVAEAMAKFNLKPAIKWPNDLLYENKKLVGILTEMSAEMDGINYVVIGTGINVNINPDDFPADIRETAASLSMMKGEKVPRVEFFQKVLRAFDRNYQSIKEGDFSEVFKKWRQYSITLGQEVKVIGVRGENSGEVFYGKAVDIDSDGALIVATATGQRRVLAGDVSIRPGI